MIAGAIEKTSGGYRIRLRAVEPMNGTVLSEHVADASGRDQVLEEMSELAAEIRDELGASDTETASPSESFTAASIEAAHDYATAQELQFAGKFEDAARHYELAIQRDPNMGRAYAGLAAVAANLGERDRAERNYRLAFARIDRMTDREKYRTRGGYYLLTRNPTKAIEEFSALVRDFPADTAGLNNLALSYFYNREMARAVRQAERTVEIYPKNALYRANAALYAMYASDFTSAIRSSRAVLAQNPAYLKAYVAMALSHLCMGNPQQAADAYSRLAAVSDRGKAMSAIGRADQALYEAESTTPFRSSRMNSPPMRMPRAGARFPINN